MKLERETQRIVRIKDVAGRPLEVIWTEGALLIKHGDAPALTLSGYYDLRKGVDEALLQIAEMRRSS